jgi:CRISPR-associated protein Cas1
MAGHILHILHHGSRLTKDRGLLVCVSGEDGEVRTLPIEDVTALIVAARGVFISMELIAALTESNAIVLHCDDSYRPVAVTSAIERVITSAALINQANRDSALHERLWKRIISGKAANQASVLERSGKSAAYLRCEIENGLVDEAVCARHYWSEYFAIFGLLEVQRHGDDEKGINAKLNYGYAVLGALVHRSIIAHGLSPLFGMHHVARYKAHAMVYDLMEPWRPYVDLALIAFERKPPGGEPAIEAWARHIAGTLKDTKVNVGDRKLSALDAIDMYVSRIANCYEEKTVRHLWVPVL